MTANSKILFTGGNGLLGSEFRKIRPDIDYPNSDEFNVSNYGQMKDYVQGKSYEIILHAAAFTSPPRIDKNPLQALQVNIVGTANVVRLCIEFGFQLIYLSTDYVFKGDQGNYKETDPVYPVNKYAWSKLGGECAVRLYDKSLIIRTTFSPNVFPFEKAFIDQWTSRENVAIIARKINTLLDKNITGVIHVGGKRKTIYELAKSLDESREVGKLSIRDVNFTVPVDTSLDSGKYNDLINSNNEQEA